MQLNALGAPKQNELTTVTVSAGGIAAITKLELYVDSGITPVKSLTFSRAENTIRELTYSTSFKNVGTHLITAKATSDTGTTATKSEYVHVTTANNPILKIIYTGKGTVTGPLGANGVSLNCGPLSSQCEVDYKLGTKVTLNSFPSNGNFGNWGSWGDLDPASVYYGLMNDAWDGICSGTSTTCTITMDSDKTAFASFYG